jgi:hypothetical protein
MTSGKLIAIHATVTLLAVWLHPPLALPPSPLTAAIPLCAFSTARSRKLFPTATLGLVCPDGAAVGAGVDVRDLRGDAFVGEASDGGKVEGWLRVDTMVAAGRRAC